jgi:hypothetical protein
MRAGVAGIAPDRLVRDMVADGIAGRAARRRGIIDR